MTGNEAIAADHYILHGNKSDAYRAGYNASSMKANTVGRRAYEVFKRPRVIAYVEKCRAEVTVKNILTRNEALAILSDIARGKLSNYMDATGEISPVKVAEAGYSLEACECLTTDRGNQHKIKIRNPIQAIERIAKMLGWDESPKMDHGGVTFNLNLAGDGSG